MYIEVRKNAFYLKNSQWDKDAKKTKCTSTYLGSDYLAAKNELEKLVIPESPILEELSKAQENYAYSRAIISTKKLWLELGDTKAGLEIYKLHEKLTKAQKKYDEKSQKNSANKSQLISDLQDQNNCDMSALINNDNEAQNKCDDIAQNNSDTESQNCPTCKTGFLQKKSGVNGSFIGCTNYPECRHSENVKPN